MKSFISRHAEKIIGVLKGFDRIVFRGHLRLLSHVGGFLSFLWHNGVLLKDFKPFAQNTTRLLKEASLKEAEKRNRPIEYLESSKTDKENKAREILKEDPVDSGLICVLKVVEPCFTFEVHRSREKKKLLLRHKPGKCQHFYHYYLDPTFGFMNARIQTWFPFTIQICINGRHWLVNQLDRAGLKYWQEDNCFPWVSNVKYAERLMDRFLEIAWPQRLDRFARALNPAHRKIFGKQPMHYYWSVHQSEWATDVMFEDDHALAKIYPALTRHAISAFSCSDVMRFLGRKVPALYRGEVVSDYKDRPEGLRVRHRVGVNSVKVYDKEKSILRVETTMNDPSDFKVFRPKQGDENGPHEWRTLRKGVADIHRRAKVCDASNNRYLDALAAVDNETSLQELFRHVGRRTTLNGRPVRALKLWDEEEVALLKAVGAGEFIVNGFRNRDIVQQLHSPTSDLKERKRRSAQMSRKLRILRAHGIIKKVKRTYRYQVTEKGRILIAAVTASLEANVSDLVKIAA
ncbi:MAG: hypothetical protein GTO40_10150 [Deltaproteobacteria bacterium]|nr:hypothetical protein [candidate division Zixibacteria bacterium]NIO08337.1 hypothetical protein [Deltaproteobacteria bacterium]